MNILKRLTFSLWYFSRPPWDTGISPPELIEFISTHPPGRAIDLGCGTGTNVITLAKHGWQTTGVDFVPRAIRSARKKIQKLGIQANLQVGDVTRLSGIDGPFDLALDIGCSHSLNPDHWKDYLATLNRVLAPNGHWLVYAHLHHGASAKISGLTETAIGQISEYFGLLSRVDGTERGSRPSAWMTFQKKN